jgi:regulator of replication initiation timing
MSEVKKLESEELKSIQDLQKQYNQFIFELGNIEAQIQNVVKTKNTLEVEKQVILEDLTKLGEREKSIVDVLQQKYGTVNIDPIDGTITPF